MLYLIALGYDEDASQLAREIASWAYEYLLGRETCRWTGNHYFAEGDEL